MANYAFIPFPDTGVMVRRVNRPSARHDRRVPGMWFGTLHVTLVCHQPLHVGSGFKAEEGGKVLRRTAREGDRLIVPGATFRGVLRSRFEAITRSCAFETPDERGRITSQSYPEVQRGRLTDEVKRMPVFDEQCGFNDRSCPACALFGFQNRDATLQGRVRVTDLTADEDTQCAIAAIPVQYAPRLQHLGEFRIDKRGREPEFEVGPLYGRKFYTAAAPSKGGERKGGAPRQEEDGPTQQVEVARKGTRFRGSIHLFNVESAELGGLFVALGVLPKSLLKVGAGKGHGFGRAAVEGMEYLLRDDRRAHRSPDVDAWRAAFEAAADRWEEGEKRLIEFHTGAC